MMHQHHKRQVEARAMDAVTAPSPVHDWSNEGHPLRWRILALMSVALIVVMLNNVTLNVALPELSVDLDADNTELQWILDAYALVFGGALLTMGALGDRFGRRSVVGGRREL